MASPNHSPSRERVERYAGRRRRYFVDNPFERRKVFYTLLAVCTTTLLLGIFTLTRSDRPYSHGPVASVHTSFDANCEACHKPQSVSGVGLSAFDPQSRWMDLTCQTCHGGPAHHAAAVWPSDWPKQDTDAQCAACHHDHNGKNFSLTRIDDSHCTKCHASLNASHKDGASTFAAKVTNFHDAAGGHPEFKKLEQPHERTLKFSHTHHMTPGIGYLAAGRGKMTKADFEALNTDDPKAVDRYRFTEAGVQLDCSSCHQLDGGRTGLNGRSVQFDGLAGEPKESILPPRAEGSYFLPVNYEAHCQTCHPLKSPTLTSDTGQKFPSFYLPHRKQPAELKEVLRARYSGYVLSEAGDRALLNTVADDETLKVGKQVERAVDKALGKLMATVNPNVKNALTGGTCTECHKLDAEGTRIRETNTPTVWFGHAKFSHVSHRGSKCLDCHPNTAAEFKADALYTGVDQKVNILGIESCRACHTPNTTRDVNGVGLGGVRSNCTDCHRYHNGDNPLQGRGAPSRNADLGTRNSDRP